MVITFYNTVILNMKLLLTLTSLLFSSFAISKDGDGTGSSPRDGDGKEYICHEKIQDDGVVLLVCEIVGEKDKGVYTFVVSNGKKSKKINRPSIV